MKNILQALNNDPVELEWKKGAAMGVVIASDGYPGKYEIDKPTKMDHSDLVTWINFVS